MQYAYAYKWVTHGGSAPYQGTPYAQSGVMSSGNGPLRICGCGVHVALAGRIPAYQSSKLDTLWIGRFNREGRIVYRDDKAAVPHFTLIRPVTVSRAAVELELKEYVDPDRDLAHALEDCATNAAGDLIYVYHPLTFQDIETRGHIMHHQRPHLTGNRALNRILNAIGCLPRFFVPEDRIGITRDEAESLRSARMQRVRDLSQQRHGVYLPAMHHPAMYHDEETRLELDLLKGRV